MAKEESTIKDLFIHVEYQRKGLGSRFINQAKAVIPPLIMVLSGRISYAASFNFCIGVIPPIAILGRSLL
jgi:GNAT superfamily N-acetyltransferase